MADHTEYALHETTPSALDKMRSHNTPYAAMVSGLEVVVYPHVWSPEYDWSSRMLVENLPDVMGQRVLEVGSGTGVISFHAMQRGAAYIEAVDLNPQAVENTRANLESSSLCQFLVHKSNGLETVVGQFDLIIWNAPYHGAKPNDDLELGCTDENYQYIRSFLQSVRDSLLPGGLLIFGFSESGDLPLIRRLLAYSGLVQEDELSEFAEGYNCMLFFMRHSA